MAALHLSRSGPVGFISSIEPDGFVTIESDHETIRLWNHRPEDLERFRDERTAVTIVSRESSTGTTYVRVKSSTDEGTFRWFTFADEPSPCITPEQRAKDEEESLRARRKREEALRDKTPLDREGERLVGFGRVLLVLERSGKWAVARWGKVVGRFDDPVEALLKFEEVASTTPGKKLTWYADCDEVLDDLTAAGHDSFLADHSVGLVNVDGWWIPASLHPNYGCNYDSLPLAASINLGKSSEERYEWNGLYLVIRREVEIGSSISIESIVPNEDELEGRFEEDETAFEHYIGLDNLKISNRPKDIDIDALRHEFFLTSYWDYGEYAIAELRIATDADRTSWYVIDTERDRVVGLFDSLERLEAAIVDEPELTLFAEAHEQLLVDEWSPGGDSLRAVLEAQREEFDRTD